MKPGQPYLVEVELRYKGKPSWPYEEEEFTFTFLLDGAPHVTATALGNSTVVLHRSGETFGGARFVVVADERSGDHSLWLSMLTQRGLVARADRLPVTILSSGQDADEDPVLPDFARRVLTTTWQQPTALQHYFIVQLMPSVPRPDTYITTVWSQEANDYAETLLADDVPQPIQELPLTLEPILGALRSRLPRAQLSVEFILPNQLLEAPVDEWVINRNPIGIDHPVVVRSLERLRYPGEDDARAAWRSKWRQLQQAGRSHDQLAMIGSRPQLKSRLQESDDLPGCLFLDFKLGTTLQDFTASPPRGGDTVPTAAEPGSGPSQAEPGSRDELITQVVEAGIPVMLWPRRSHEHGIEQVYSLIRTAGVHALPLSVHELRRERFLNRTDTGSKWHGPELSLLWDDPERFPGRPPQFANP